MVDLLNSSPLQSLRVTPIPERSIEEDVHPTLYVIKMVPGDKISNFKIRITNEDEDEEDQLGFGQRA